MKGRWTYTIDGGAGRADHRRLEAYRRELCAELRRVGKGQLADAYLRMTLDEWAAHHGCVIVK